MSRLAKMRREQADDDYVPDMPPLGGMNDLIKYLYEMGPVVAAGSGAGPVTFSEILAWCQLTGVALQPWEARLIRRLSAEYLSESHKAEKRDAQAPWRPEDVKPEPSSTQLALRALARL